MAQLVGRLLHTPLAIFIYYQPYWKDKKRKRGRQRPNFFCDKIKPFTDFSNLNSNVFGMLSSSSSDWMSFSGFGNLHNTGKAVITDLWQGFVKVVTVRQCDQIGRFSPFGRLFKLLFRWFLKLDQNLLFYVVKFCGLYEIHFWTLGPQKVCKDIKIIPGYSIHAFTHRKVH